MRNITKEIIKELKEDCWTKEQRELYVKRVSEELFNSFLPLISKE